MGAWDLDCKANGYAGYGDLLVVPSDAPAYIDSLTRSGYSSDWESTLSDDETELSFSGDASYQNDGRTLFSLTVSDGRASLFADGTASVSWRQRGPDDAVWVCEGVATEESRGTGRHNVSGLSRCA